jgi:hypothetical protein
MTNPGTSAGRKRSPKTDDKLVLALRQQPTLDKAAAAAGISTATAWRRTQDPDFQDKLRKARREVCSQSVGRLQQGPSAVNTLLRVMANPAAAAGPRPAIPSEVAQYQRWQRRRLRMRPGLTCLWAVNGRDEVDFETWMKLDLEYIDNWSLGLDCKILLRTIPQVLSGRGAS